MKRDNTLLNLTDRINVLRDLHKLEYPKKWDWKEIDTQHMLVPQLLDALEDAIKDMKWIRDCQYHGTDNTAREFLKRWGIE